VHLENGVIEDLSEPLRHPEERDYTMSNNLLKNNSQPMMKRKVTLRNKKSVIVESLLLDKKTILTDKLPICKSNIPNIVSSPTLPLESTSNVKAYGPSCLRELASQGVLSEVVVAYRDRLCRFAFELIEWLLHSNGVKLVVLNESLEKKKVRGLYSNG
jgi:hypothetical protein